MGKTYSISEFGRSHFKSYFKFDFEEDRSLNKIFDENLDPKTLMPLLEARIGQRISPGESLIFFDEIQACPRALTSLRYFYEKMPALHVVAAGSLLEFSLGEVSFPVGRVEFEWMYPMNFAEFLEARGKSLLKEYLPSLKTQGPLPAPIHDQLLGDLRFYFAVGGMPQAVRQFVETNSVVEAAKIHQTLNSAILQDCLKYHRRADPECLQTVLEQIPRRVGEQIKYSRLYPEKPLVKIKEALRLLETSLLVHRVRAASGKGTPLGADISEKVFKCVFLDIGLMQSLCGVRVGEILEARELTDAYRGALAEQFVGQEMLCQRTTETPRLFYWSRPVKNSNAEVDYLSDSPDGILPVEVKSGAPGKLRSLQVYFQEHPDCPFGVVLSSRNAGVAPGGRLRFLPLYANVS